MYIVCAGPDRGYGPKIGFAQLKLTIWKYSKLSMLATQWKNKYLALIRAKKATWPGPGCVCITCTCITQNMHAEISCIKMSMPRAHTYTSSMNRTTWGSHMTNQMTKVSFQKKRERNEWNTVICAMIDVHVNRRRD